MSGNDTDEISEELFQSVFHWYQIDLEKPMRSCNFAFYYVDGLVTSAIEFKLWWIINE